MTEISRSTDTDRHSVISRITEDEAAEVAELWDRMCRAVPDGGPLTARGRRNIERMLAAASYHHQTACLVAHGEREGAGRGPVGFVMARVDPGDGLLPCLSGEIQELYADDDRALAVELAEAAVAWLRQQDDLWTIRVHVDAEDPATQALWRDRGFQPDLVTLSLYRDPEPLTPG